MIKRWQGAALVLAVLMSFGIFNNAQATPEIDTAAPIIESLEVSLAKVNTTDGEQKVLITMHLKDDVSGINNVSLNFASPSGNSIRSAGLFLNQYDGTYAVNTNSYPYESKNALLSGTGTDGVFQAELVLPQYSEAGIWKLSNISISDKINNYNNYSSWNNFEGLNMANIATEILNEATVFDASAPTIESLEMSPAKVNTTDGEQKVLITMHLKDDLTGISSVYFNFTSPSGNNSKSAGFSFNQYDETYTISGLSYPYEPKNALLSGTSTDGVFQIELILPQYSEAGIWKLSNIQVADKISNYSNYSSWNNFGGLSIATEILNEAVASDSGAPTLESLEFLPATVDTSTGNKKVVVKMHLIDDNTGVSSANLSFTSPSGGSSLMAGFYFNAFTGEYPINSMTYPYEPTNALVSGSSADGIFQAELVFPPSSEIGDWKLSSINISDKINNNRYYSQWDNFGGLNIPTIINNEAISTPTVTTTGITVKTPPAKIIYTEGENLDLFGLIVTLSKSDGSTRDVDFADFSANSITTDKTNGAVLSVGDMVVAIMADDHSVNQAIAVNTVLIPISTAAISGISAPVTDATPTSSITGTDEYTATIFWNDNPTTFAPGTAYTATITIAPKTNNTLSGIAENFFTVVGATTTNVAGSGVVTAVFPETVAVQAPSASGANGPISSTALQSDGKIVIGGKFTAYNEAAVNNIARLNIDGTLDTSFNSGVGVDNSISLIAVQSDDKIILSGYFTAYNNVNRRGIARLNSDGTLDTTFNSSIDVYGKSFAIQPDGKIIVVSTRNQVIRLNTDGTLDASFNSVAGIWSNGYIYAIAVQSDGRIIIGGFFLAYDISNSSGIARLNADGTLDSTFLYGPNSIMRDRDIETIDIQADGKIIVAGNGHGYNGVRGHYVIRLNTDGTPDPTFISDGINGTVYSTDIQSDGKIIIAGAFSSVNGRFRGGIARIILATTIQSNDKIIISGDFTSVNGVIANRITRLNVDGALDTTFNSGVMVPVVTGISIKKPPTKNIYSAGDSLDLSGLVVELDKSDGSLEDVAFENFSKYNITTYKKQGDVLSGEDRGIKIMYDGYPASFELYQPIEMDYWSSIDDTSVNSNSDSSENLVVVTHGLNDRAESGWLRSMHDDILSNAISNTTVKIYDWQEKAKSPCGGDCFWGADNVEVFKPIYKNAANQGQYLANHITSYKTLPKNIHLIAHSVGSNLIQETVNDLANYRDTHPDWDPYIHLTFLDAFAPWNSYEPDRYGNLQGFRGYAEQYVDMPDLPYTNLLLKSATNFDVSYLTNSSNRDHGWPYKFYDYSVKDYSYPQSDVMPKLDGNGSNKFAIGFLLSEESNRHIDSTEAVSHKNQWCIVTNVADPYRRCFDHSVEEKRDVIITDQNTPVFTDVPNGVVDYTIDVSQFIGFKNGVAIGEIPSIKIGSELVCKDTPINMVVDIPHTNIESSVTGWNGIIHAPISFDWTKADINEIGGENYGENPISFSIGYTDGTLWFDDAVKITLLGEARSR